MKKEKHKWKKIKEKIYVNYIGEPDTHTIIYSEHYECEKCGAKK